MKKLYLLLLIFFLGVGITNAQKVVTGNIVDESGVPVIGANVVVKGTTVGTITDFDGNFSLNVPESASTLVISYTGFATQERAIDGQSVLNFIMNEGKILNEVVVTAFGVEREKKSLGYATQEVSGDELTRAKDANFINSLSGKIAGVDIQRTTNLGGSSNVIIRGYTSLRGNNNALFVVDGVPINNDISNTTNQQSGRGGYDYGNAAMDINPEDIENVSVLRGAAATALYGSRAANGVILITTKKGSKGKDLGISFSTGVTMGLMDRSTFPRYQKQYGHGYSNHRGWYGDTTGLAFDYYDFGEGDGEQRVGVVYEDASHGPEYDGQPHYDWKSFYPELKEFYGKTSPYQVAENGAETFYETALTFNNSIAVDGGTDKSSYRLSYTNFNTSGVLPNSNINRNTVSLGASYDISDKLTASTSGSFINTQGLGRYGTGYDNRNVNQSFRQWFSPYVDMEEQKMAYDLTGKNISWNPYATLNPAIATQPHYFDNYYFNRFENFSSDGRNRLLGNVSLNYELNSWLNLTGRVGMDSYNELQEERIAVGSVDVPEYSRFNKGFTEINYDLLLNFNKYFMDDKLNLNGNVGTNIRRSTFSSIRATTNGGLVVPNVYSLSNSLNAIQAPNEVEQKIGVNGYFAQASLGYNNFIYLDLAGRYDVSSTLPSDNNAYFYPSASLSLIFSEFINSDVLSFGKLRANYAQVGNDAPFASINDIYNLGTPFGGQALASASATKRNSQLRPERTTSIEIGTELKFFRDRVGLDLSVYQSTSFDQILPVSVSPTTGRLFEFVNAGEIENRGLEIALTTTPVQTKNFSWDFGVNWAANRNEVKSLFGDQTNLQISTAQGGVSFNATVGQPFGTIWGTNYYFDESTGEPIVYLPGGSFGEGARHRRTGSPEVIGDINPDFKMGITNGFRFGRVGFNFLIDIQRGGDFFTLDNYYGFATGIYEHSAGNNDKGNPVRDAVADGGGYNIGGVIQDQDADGNYLFDDDGNPVSSGTANTSYGYARDFFTSDGYWASPNAKFVYDASFVKLREMAVSYSLPKSLFDNSVFSGADISLTGRNLWIIFKNSPYSDPEAGLSAGTYQLGNQSGAYPSVREIGANLKFRF